MTTQVAPAQLDNTYDGVPPSMPFPVEVPPMDEYNRQLLANVHPPAWQNPTPDGRYNLVVIGAGTAGLVGAIGAAGLGGKVALVERHLIGGDSTAPVSPAWSKRSSTGGWPGRAAKTVSNPLGVVMQQPMPT
jgi:cation diffusion facilitator CzcD-associated flavoprotein CzcO